MSQEITLYHYWRSSASWRVRWGLALKGIPFRAVAVDLLQAEEKGETYRSRNPSGYVPCLVVGSQILGESMAILEWLEECQASPSFFSGDAFMRARIRQLAETVNSGIQPLQNLDVVRRFSPDQKAQQEWTAHWIRRGLEVFESLLPADAGGRTRFCVAEHPTLADLFLIPQCYSAERFQVDLTVFPRCQTIYRRAMETRECRASAPDSFQPG